MKKSLLIALLLLAVSAFARSGMRAVDGEIKLTLNPGKSGLTEVTFILRPCSEKSKFSISFAPKPALKYSGEHNVETTAQNGQEERVSFLLEVPPNDTTAFSFRIWEKGELCTRSGGGARWFITTGDTLILTASRPYPDPVYPHAAKIDSTPPVEHFPLSDTLLFRNPDIAVMNDSTGRVVIDSVGTEWLRKRKDRTPFDPKDILKAQEALKDSLEQRDEERQRRLDEWQKNRDKNRPSPDAQRREFIKENPVAIRVEMVGDGDTVWVRREGDSAFTVAKGYGSPAEYRAERARKYPPRERVETYDLIVDLRDPEHRQHIESVVDSLRPTSKPGFFRIDVDQKTLKVLNRYRVPRAKYPDFPVQEESSTHTDPAVNEQPGGREFQKPSLQPPVAHPSPGGLSRNHGRNPSISSTIFPEP